MPTLKKEKTLTHEPTEKKECKMTMTRKLNNDNGLQDWKTEHQAVTDGIFYCRDSAEIMVCGSLQTSSWFDSDVLRTAKPSRTPLKIFNL